MARGRKSSLVVLLTATKRRELEALQRRTTVSTGLARRARMVLLRADGGSLADVARRVEVAPRVVAKWLKRYRQQGLRGLGDKRAGASPGLFPPKWRSIWSSWLVSAPSCVARVSPNGMARNWRVPSSVWGHGEHLAINRPPDSRPSQTQTVAPSYVAIAETSSRCRVLCTGDGPYHALHSPLRPDEMVLSLDQKTSLQPRPRLHPTKPAQAGLPNRVEHEYRRDGALNLFAAFDTRTGRVYGQCQSRKRQREFLVFLASLEAEIPATIQTIHVVCDNVSTHHGKEVRQWLQSHPRFVFHFTRFMAHG